MDAMLKGKLQRWNDDKGYGFLEPEQGGEQVFIHISALKNKGRRPVIGDTIWYQLEIGRDGKAKAASASIIGVPVVRRRAAYAGRNKGRGFFSKMKLLVIVVAVGWFAYYGITEKLPSVSDINTQHTPATSDNGFELEVEAKTYQCDGRVHCSQMTSREEAEYFVQHCPGTMMDGDDDGVPCENDSRW